MKTVTESHVWSANHVAYVEALYDGHPPESAEGKAKVERKVVSLCGPVLSMAQQGPLVSTEI